MAIDILLNFDKTKHNYTDSLNYGDPNGGWLYLFYTEDRRKLLDYKADIYKWKNNGNNKPAPHGNPVIYKTFMYAVNSTAETSADSDFTKTFYKLINKDVPILIHYLGNNEKYRVGQAHGNCKISTVPYKRAIPSATANLKDQLRLQNLHIVYKNSNQTSRNLKQCQNLKYAINK